MMSSGSARGPDGVGQPAGQPAHRRRRRAQLQEVRPAARDRHWSTISSLNWPCSPDHRAHTVTSCLVFALPTFPTPRTPRCPPCLLLHRIRCRPPPPHRAAPGAVRRAPRCGVRRGRGGHGLVCVGGSVAVSSVLAGAPVFTAEAVRYGAACLILVALAHLTGRRLSRPRGAQWLWLSGIAVTDPGVAARLRPDGPEAHPVPLRVGIAAASLPQGGKPAAAAPAGRPVQRRLAGLRHPGRGLRRRQGRLAARGAVRGRRRGLPDVRRGHRASRARRGDLRRPGRAGACPALDEPAERPFRRTGLHRRRADRGRGAAPAGRVRCPRAHRQPGCRTRRRLVRHSVGGAPDPQRAPLHVRSVSPVTPVS